MKPASMAAMAGALGSDWAKTMHMVYRAQDNEGRSRFRVNFHKWHLQVRKWRKRGGTA